MNTSSLKLAAAACLSLAALLLAAGSAFAQGAPPTSNYTNAFDMSSDTASWIYWYGSGYNNTAMTWDSTHDAGSGSGSLQVSIPFGTNGDQAVWFGTWHNQYGYDGSTIYDGTKFTNITFDLLVSNGSPVSASGDFGVLQCGLVRQGWLNGGTFDTGSPTIPGAASNGWVHMNQVIDQTGAHLDTVAGVDFKYTSYSGYPKDPIMFWIDNLVVHLSPAAPKPPTIANPYDPIAGLNLFSGSSNGDQYQRTNLRLQSNTGTTWLGASGPVTYSVTITNFPSGANYPGYQCHIFLVSGPSIPNYETAPDYNETNLIFLDIHQNANGTAYGAFRYKVNLPNSNANLYGNDNGTAGTLGYAGAANILGTWSITFSNDTNITVTAPGGGTFTTNLPSSTVANFVEPLNVIFGGQPNGTANFGQSVVLAAASVSGNAMPVSDNFMADSVLDTTTWAILTGDQTSVQLIPVGTGGKWVKWSLPDSGFVLQTSTGVGNPNSWVYLTGPEATNTLVSFASAGSRFVLVPQSSLGSTTANYFRLIQDSFTKLQVLMPGETAAPGTGSGKTGTPTAQQVGVPFDVTVNAVDQNWFKINGVIDTVHITSSDGSASLPPDAALVNGTGTFSVTFLAQGTWTVTASDVTDNTKASNTGSPTMANP